MTVPALLNTALDKEGEKREPPRVLQGVSSLKAGTEGGGGGGVNIDVFHRIGTSLP